MLIKAPGAFVAPPSSGNESSLKCYPREAAVLLISEVGNTTAPSRDRQGLVVITNRKLMLACKQWRHLQR